LTFHPRKKSSSSQELKKKLLQNRPQRVSGYQKKRNFALIIKMCRSLKFSEREKNTEKAFLEKKSSETS
jgi:hypothetical protein